MAEHNGVIKPLDPSVIAKIAAGEVVLRPAAAIKELIENSIDAGATEIKINIADNPLEYVEVSDNGHGISPEDMRLVCKRYTTSKTHDNIVGVKSFGFRGEALAALSHASNVTISSRTCKQTMRLVMKYHNGEPLVDIADEKAGPVGTTITYENLFFNMGTREKALSSSPSVEFNLCLELVQNYAMHFPDFKFVFHKVGSSTNDLMTDGSIRAPSNNDASDHIDSGSSPEYNVPNTDYDYKHFNMVDLYPPESNGTPSLLEYKDNVVKYSKMHLRKVKEVISLIYGTAVSNALYEFQVHSTSHVYYNCKGFFTHPNETNRCHSFILFVNNRLVEHPGLKKNIDKIYKELMHKKQRRFVYLSIYMPYERIDANVHPSKEKVFFKHQEEIVEEIGDKLRERLRNILQINTENMQKSSVFIKLESKNNVDIGEPLVPHLKRVYEVSEISKPAAKSKVRRDRKQMEIQSFVIPTYIQESNASLGSSQMSDINFDLLSVDNGMDNLFMEQSTQIQDENLQESVAPILGNIDFNMMEFGAKETICRDMWNIPFVKESIEEFDNNRDKDLTEIVAKSVFVGPIDERYILLQHDKRLYMVDIVHIAKECAYQSVVWRIGQLPRIFINPGLSIVALISYALARNEYHERNCNECIDPSLYSERASLMIRPFIVDILTKYFGFTIQNNTLLSIPRVISNYFPGQEYIPDLILDLFSVDIEEERNAVLVIAKIVSGFWTSPPINSITMNDKKANEQNYAHYLSKVLLVSVQRFPDLSLSNDRIEKGAIIKLAELELLYRIFERC
ncbi:DNA mismatch repair protein C-terminal domain family protein [Babesia bovis T2Bo]|uniref:DNA mismatch repair protein C-terminal domain family protein n=1 Tax=Babesia bovis T2Bo TaxID=484906 RepID=UPI001D563AE3|nr:DNA mismatch repair protein C-terminal domain family protein [Babesia bovis T2Bo]EDO07444.2 DNA mismatch repair protein C-terminal domain family protein [Babesia bovis T2Bo]